MEVRLLSVGARGFFSRRFATRLFAAQFCRPQREKKTSGTQGKIKEDNMDTIIMQ